MKTKLGLLVSLSLALVFVAYGFATKTRMAPLVPFEEYSKMENVRDRKAALAKESPYAKSMLWRQHLAYYEVKLELNAEQKAFLKRVSDFLDEKFFETPANMTEAAYIKTERGKPFKELMVNVKTLFKPEQSRQLFLTVGDTSTITDWGCRAAQPSARDGAEDSDPYAAKVHGPNASEAASGNSAAPSFACNCIYDSFCGSGCGDRNEWRCAPGSPCQGTQCGCFGYWNCDGWCERVMIIQ